MEPTDSQDLIDLIRSGGLGLAALVYLSRLIERLIRSVENYANLERVELADGIKFLGVKVDRLLVNQERIIIALTRYNASLPRPSRIDLDDET